MAGAGETANSGPPEGGRGGLSSGWAARCLLRAARSGALASQADGQPFASLVTPATAPDGTVLMLLSDLAEHSRHLRADPRCAVLVSGPAQSANPQTTPRLTVTGVAEVADDPALRARYLAIHPYAGLYAGFGDFHLWRLVPAAGLLVGGFGRAARLRAASLLPDPAAAAAVAAAEAALIAEANLAHRALLARLAGAAGGEAWEVVAIDVDGFDVAPAGTRPAAEAGPHAEPPATVRIPWSEPARGPEDVRDGWARLAVAEAGKA